MCAHKDSDDVPHGTIALIRSSFLVFGHLAGWAVMYALGVAVALGLFLEIPVSGLGLVFVGLCSHGGYLFDRVKFRDLDLDPADLLADPPRHKFLRRWAGPLRIVMFGEWIGAVAVGVVMSPVLGVVVLGGVLAGYMYSGWRPGGLGGRSRLKDVPGLKAGLVSCAVVGLGLVGVLGSEIVWENREVLRETLAVSWVSVLGVWLIVFGDAVVCDLDDVFSDAEFSTRSLPVMMGSFWAGVMAVVLLVAGGIVVILGGLGAEGVSGRVLFSGMIVVSGVGILRQGRRRDWIDGRMLVVAVVVLFVG